MGISLSEILKRLHILDEIDLSKSFKSLETDFDSINENRRELKYINNHEITSIENDIRNLIKRYENALTETRSKLRETVYGNHNAFLAENDNIYRLHFDNMTFAEHAEWINLWPPNENNKNNFFSQITNNLHWQQPALIYGANTTNLTKISVAAEPLYVMEKHKDYFDLQKEMFASDYVRRMRFYHVDEMNRLPRNIFSVIAIYNQFPFLPWKNVNDILGSLIPCLAPGGVLLFNYNNCLTSRGFENFERKVMTYSTADMYKELCTNAGLGLMKSFDADDEAFSYLVFSRPGKMNLIKKYPTVGIVKKQPTFKDQVLHDLRLAKIKRIFKS